MRIARDRIAYHQGFLVVDRGSTSSLRKRERRRLHALATAAHAAAASGLVYLVQERLDAGTFRYIAVKALQKPNIKASRYHAGPAPPKERSARESVDQVTAGDPGYREAERAVPGSAP